MSQNLFFSIKTIFDVLWKIYGFHGRVQWNHCKIFPTENCRARIVNPWGLSKGVHKKMKNLNHLRRKNEKFYMKNNLKFFRFELKIKRVWKFSLKLVVIFVFINSIQNFSIKTSRACLIIINSFFVMFGSIDGTRWENHYTNTFSCVCRILKFLTFQAFDIFQN